MSKFGSSPCISLWAAAKSHYVVPELLRVPLPPRDAGVHYSSSGQMYPSVVEWLCALRLHPHTIRRRKTVRVWFQSSRQISFFSDYSFKIQNTTTTTKNLRPISVCSQNHHSEGEQNFPDILPTSTHTFLLLNHARLQVTGVSTATTTWLYNYKLTLTWVHHERINLKLLRLIWWWQSLSTSFDFQSLMRANAKSGGHGDHFLSPSSSNSHWVTRQPSHINLFWIFCSI